jgi:hypothetical protein
MNDVTKRSILRWITSSLAFRYSVIFIVRLKKFQITAPNCSVCLASCNCPFRDFRCGKAVSFDDLSRKLEGNEILKIQFS